MPKALGIVNLMSYLLEECAAFHVSASSQVFMVGRGLVQVCCMALPDFLGSGCEIRG